MVKDKKSTNNRQAAAPSWQDLIEKYAKRRTLDELCYYYEEFLNSDSKDQECYMLFFAGFSHKDKACRQDMAYEVLRDMQIDEVEVPQQLWKYCRQQEMVVGNLQQNRQVRDEMKERAYKYSGQIKSSSSTNAAAQQNTKADKQPERRGRKGASKEAILRDEEYVQDWLRAKKAGIRAKDFAKDNSKTLREHEKILNRVKMRDRRQNSA